MRKAVFLLLSIFLVNVAQAGNYEGYVLYHKLLEKAQGHIKFHRGFKNNITYGQAQNFIGYVAGAIDAAEEGNSPYCIPYEKNTIELATEFASYLTLNKTELSKTGLKGTILVRWFLDEKYKCEQEN